VEAEKRKWMAEQAEMNQRERVALGESVDNRKLTEAPLGTVDLTLPIGDLTQAALEFVRRDDEIALRHLSIDALSRARSAIAAGDAERLEELIDKLTCLAATFLAYGRNDQFEEMVKLLVGIYGAAFRGEEPMLYGYAGTIGSDKFAPRVWLAIAERVLALGGMAVRQENWDAVRILSVQLPGELERDGYEVTWLRHAVTMASRAGHFQRQDENGKTDLSLIALARAVAARLACLRPDLGDADDDALLTSIAQFDLLWNTAAVGVNGSPDGKAFYPSFARFRQERIEPVVDRLIRDPGVRAALFPGTDAQLATALDEIGRMASNEAWRYEGFRGWDDRTVVGTFIRENLPSAGPT
jgi:hypothetical protein